MDTEKAGVFLTEPEYTMHHLGGFPGVIEGGDTRIMCELYDVDSMTFRRLDGLEGYNPIDCKAGLYDRKQIPSPLGDAWIYLYNNNWGGLDESSVISSGEW